MEKYEVTSINAELLDVCLPCYFQGTNAEEVLAVAVHRDMTREEFYQACINEFDAQIGWFDMADAGTMGEDAIRATVLAMESGGYFEQSFPYCESLEESEEDDSGEFSYAYVGLFAESDT